MTTEKRYICKRCGVPPVEVKLLGGVWKHVPNLQRDHAAEPMLIEMASSANDAETQVGLDTRRIERLLYLLWFHTDVFNALNEPQKQEFGKVQQMLANYHKDK